MEIVVMNIIKDYLIGKGIDKGVDWFKYLFYEMPQKRCLNTLHYMTNGDKEELKKLFKKIETDEKFRERLYDIFEVARRTQSVLALKTLSLIFKENQDNENMKQKACRAFAEINDETLEFFLKLLEIEEEKKTINRNYSVYVKGLNNLYLDLYNKEDVKYFIFDLKNRGFIINSDFEGSNWGGGEEDFACYFSLTDLSNIYKDKIQQAKKIKDRIAPKSKILTNVQKQNDKT